MKGKPTQNKAFDQYENEQRDTFTGTIGITFAWFRFITSISYEELKLLCINMQGNFMPYYLCTVKIMLPLLLTVIRTSRSCVNLSRF